MRSLFCYVLDYKDIFLNEGHSKGAIDIKLILYNDVVERYNQYYFSQHPKAKKKQIEHAYHPSINIWSIKPRIQMNALKQSWKNFYIC